MAETPTAYNLSECDDRSAILELTEPGGLFIPVDIFWCRLRSYTGNNRYVPGDVGVNGAVLRPLRFSSCMFALWFSSTIHRRYFRGHRRLLSRKRHDGGTLSLWTVLRKELILEPESCYRRPRSDKPEGGATSMHRGFAENQANEIDRFH